jgi:ribose-phosphate pyrophosphokinase
MPRLPISEGALKRLKENLFLLAGSANPSLSQSLAAELDLTLGTCRLETYPDDEMHVLLQESVRDKDVYLVQSTARPVADNIIEILLIADACRRAGAGRITGMVSYLAYARQERRTDEGEPVSARIMADLLATRLDRIICVDLHNPALEGFFSIPMVHVSALPLLVKRLERGLPEKAVIVAPDLGAVKLARRFADLLDLPVAFIHKERQSGAQVTFRNIIGEVKGRHPILVDDMISTGGTVVSAVEALLEQKAYPDMTVVATHGVFAGNALKRFEALPVKKIIVTDSVEAFAAENTLVETISLANLLAKTVCKLAGEAK